jgi:ribosomal-protein-alanine N-acetyltransferase
MLLIRQVHPNDIFSVIKITYESLPERYNPIIFNTFYENYPEGFLIAEKNRKIVGFIIGTKTSHDTVRITMLAVNKDYRRQGFGSNLLINLLKKLAEKNISQVDLEVKTDNNAAINFYKKHGFTITDNVPSFYKSGEDAYIMRRILNSN